MDPSALSGVDVIVYWGKLIRSSKMQAFPQIPFFYEVSFLLNIANIQYYIGLKYTTVF